MSQGQAIGRRARQLVRLWRTEGPSGIGDRVRVRLARLLVPPGSGRLPIGTAEFEAAAALTESGWQLPRPLPWVSGQPLKVGWVSTPPAPGSGGHTTMFRLVNALMSAGHECTVYLTDRHGWEMEQHRERIQIGWPDMRADVLDFDDGVEDCHALFATGWDSAWAILRSKAEGLRCYLVQDFEPAFYPAGSEYLLAEATYRFGFQGITAGTWLPGLLRDRYGMDAWGFAFGCDLASYRLLGGGEPRTGVCYYCRPS
ncbi:MAG: glycosyltransferase family 1 protein, partial [Actinomycetes bacterium]